MDRQIFIYMTFSSFQNHADVTILEPTGSTCQQLGKISVRLKDELLNHVDVQATFQTAVWSRRSKIVAQCHQDLGLLGLEGQK